MIGPVTALVRVVKWIASHLELDLHLHEDGVVESLDEHEVSQQLQYGRD